MRGTCLTLALALWVISPGTGAFAQVDVAEPSAPTPGHPTGHPGAGRIRAARAGRSFNRVVQQAGVPPQPLCPNPQEPILTSVPSCGLGSMRPPPDSSCDGRMSAASYSQMNFLARQAAQAIANAANSVASTLTCLYGEPTSPLLVINAAAHISEAFCSNDPHRQAYVDCDPLPGAAASWNGGAGEGPGFHGTLNLREEKFRHGIDNANAMAAMVTVIHETLHAMIEYMRTRHHLTTDPEQHQVTVTGPSGDIERSNRCLNRLADHSTFMCDVSSPTSRVGRDQATEMVTQMAVYPMGGDCTGRPTADFDTRCRASGYFREEAAVRSMAETIARQCASSIPMFFQYGDFRTR